MAIVRGGKHEIREHTPERVASCHLVMSKTTGYLFEIYVDKRLRNKQWPYSKTEHHQPRIFSWKFFAQLNSDFFTSGMTCSAAGMGWSWMVRCLEAGCHMLPPLKSYRNPIGKDRLSTTIFQGLCMLSFCGVVYNQKNESAQLLFS